MAANKALNTETNAPNIKVALLNELITGPPAVALLCKGGLLPSPISSTSSQSTEAGDKSATTPDSVAILDNATGAGNLIFRFLEERAKQQGQGQQQQQQQQDQKGNARLPTVERLVGGDIDEDYLAFLRTRAAKAKEDNDANSSTTSIPTSGIEVLRLDQQKLSPTLADGSFTHVFNNFGVFFVPQDGAVLQETLRVLKGDSSDSVQGFAGFSSWHSLAWWDEIAVPALKQDIVVDSVDGQEPLTLPPPPPLPHPMDMFRRSGWTEGATSEQKLRDAGFIDVGSEVYKFQPGKDDISPADFALAASVLVRAISARAWDQPTRDRYDPHIQHALHSYLITTFPNGGRWPGSLAALLTWGRKP